MLRNEVTWKRASLILKCACLNECFDAFQELSSQINLEEKIQEAQDLIISYHLTKINCFIQQQQQNQCQQTEKSLLRLKRVVHAANPKVKIEIICAMQQLHEICVTNEQFSSILQQLTSFRNVNMIETTKIKAKIDAEAYINSKHVRASNSGDYNVMNRLKLYHTSVRRTKKNLNSNEQKQAMLPGRIRGWLGNREIDGSCKRLRTMRQFFEKNKRLSKAQMNVVEKALKPYETIRIWLESPLYLEKLPYLRKKWLKHKWLNSEEIKQIQKVQHCLVKELNEDEAETFWQKLSFNKKKFFL